MLNLLDLPEEILLTLTSYSSLIDTRRALSLTCQKLRRIVLPAIFHTFRPSPSAKTLLPSAYLSNSRLTSLTRDVHLDAFTDGTALGGIALCILKACSGLQSIHDLESDCLEDRKLIDAISSHTSLHCAHIKLRQYEGPCPSYLPFTSKFLYDITFCTGADMAAFLPAISNGMPIRSLRFHIGDTSQFQVLAQSKLIVKDLTHLRFYGDEPFIDGEYEDEELLPERLSQYLAIHHGPLDVEIDDELDACLAVACRFDPPSMPPSTLCHYVCASKSHWRKDPAAPNRLICIQLRFFVRTWRFTHQVVLAMVAIQPYLPTIESLVLDCDLVRDEHWDIDSVSKVSLEELVDALFPYKHLIDVELHNVPVDLSLPRLQAMVARMATNITHLERVTWRLSLKSLVYQVASIDRGSGGIQVYIETRNAKNYNM